MNPGHIFARLSAFRIEPICLNGGLGGRMGGHAAAGRGGGHLPDLIPGRSNH